MLFLFLPSDFAFFAVGRLTEVSETDRRNLSLILPGLLLLPSLELDDSLLKVVLAWLSVPEPVSRELELERMWSVPSTDIFSSNSVFVENLLIDCLLSSCPRPDKP